MEHEIIGLLKEIKTAIHWLLALVCLGVLASWIRASIGIRSAVKGELDKLFSQEASDLYDKGQWNELIAFCAEQLDRKPNHSYALWYIAKAHYRKSEMESAKLYFQRLAQAEPSWDDNYVKPYLSKISDTEEADSPATH